jgi:hypothetical protein
MTGPETPAERPGDGTPSASRPLWRRKRLWIPVGVVGVAAVAVGVSAPRTRPRPRR